MDGDEEGSDALLAAAAAAAAAATAATTDESKEAARRLEIDMREQALNRTLNHQKRKAKCKFARAPRQ